MKTTLRQCKPGDVVRFGPNTTNCIVTAERVPAARLILIEVISTRERFWRGEDDDVWRVS